MPAADQLSKRERQIMDVIYRLKEGSVAGVRAAMASPPSYSSVRTTLNILVRKGFLGSVQKARKYVYVPKVARAAAGRHAVRRMVETYFDNSIREAVFGLISAGARELTEEDYARIIGFIEETRSKEGAL
jgi:predicted transcriptional regulator